ncbi:MAG: CDP-alcohol phosphatidyltransferase family protein [Bifidobacteriaceae bacterium]|jgi:CDP-diacylglycerol--glycerol-3-phosphate 3-phosphatidyltransferase|nr:CDP-alcohol phosphatidyltransferase family protein [Bifidobacteriaceae bacterium]
MLGANSKPLEQRIFGKPAALLVKWHVHPNAVTVAGTAAIAGVALGLYPTGHLWLGSVILAALVCTDALDGTMARLTGKSNNWGAWLDSTMDRVSDASIFIGLTLFFVVQGEPLGHALWGVIAGIAAVAAGALVPYARARAEGLGLNASVGIAERTDRLIVVLWSAFLGDLITIWILVGGLALLAVAGFVTVGQRAWAVYTQVRAAS